MISIFNEKEYAQKLLQNGFISNKIGFDLFILAKFFRFVEGLKQTQCKKALVDFCKLYFDNYEFGGLYNKVNATIRSAYKPNAVFLEIKQVTFSKEEVNYVTELDLSQEARQTIFALWTLGKINKQAKQVENWVNINAKEIKEISNLHRNTNVYDILHELYVKDKIFVTDKGAICLKFLGEIKFPEVIDFEINTFENLGNLFERFSLDHSKFILCDICGKKEDRLGPLHKYCRKCSKKKTLESNRISDKKWRESKKMSKSFKA